VFRLLPGLEHTFLLSPFARLLISPNTLDALFDGWRNNVLDPAKAGGIFVNANIASAYLGMSAVAAWYVGRAHASKLLRTVAMLDWVAVAFTGSKAGLVCALIVPLAMMTITVAQRRKAHPLSFVGVTLTLACVVVVMLLPIGRETLEAYGSETSATLGTREQIWQFAWQMARQHPFTGLGFGGWEQRFQLPAMLQGFAVSIPPHNSLFILWLQSGALGLAAGTAFVFAVFAAGWRAARTHSLLAMATAGAFAWYLIQGMGENFGLVGEIHMTPLLGALLGYSCAQHDNVSVPHECGVKILRSPDPSPALPAV
jgi:O-antigen ligase